MTSQSPTPCVLLVEDDRSTQVLYAQALERCTVLYLTEVDREAAGDVRFPSKS